MEKLINSLTLVLTMFIFLVACNHQKSNSEESQPSIPKDISERKLVDLSHAYSDETVYWVTAKEFKLDTVFNGQTDKGYYYSANDFSTAEHGGTHIDAPIHFAKGGQSVHEIPIENLIGKAIKIDVSSKSINNPDYLITIDDIREWEIQENIQIPEGSIILLQTGHSKFYPNKIKYLGTDERGEEAIKKLHFPGLSAEAARWLVDNRSINAIGIDTPSIDFGQSQYFESHVILLSQNIPAFENLTNLEQLPSKGFDVIALPMKIKDGSGAPLRIIALME